MGGMPPKQPDLTDEEMICLSNELSVLSQILQPARLKNEELVVEVAKFLAIFPFGLRNDNSLMQAKIDGWCDDLEMYPLYAIKRALGYWRRNSMKEPSLSEVLADVKLFMGRNVLARKRILEKMRL